MTWFEVLSIIGVAVSVFGGALATVVWFILKNLIYSLRKLEQSMNEHKIFSLQTFAKDTDVKDSLRDLKSTMNVMQNALNTNTNLTSVVSEKITTMAERLNHRN